MNDKSYSYSLGLIKFLNLHIIKNHLLFYEWKGFFDLLILIFKDKLIINYYFYNKKKLFLNIKYLFNIYIKNKYMINFIKIIFKDNMFLNFNLIYFFFVKIYEKKHNIISVVILTKYILNKRNIKYLKYKIKKRYCEEIFFSFKKEKKIISGFKIYINDFVLDESLLNKIKNFINLKHINKE